MKICDILLEETFDSSEEKWMIEQTADLETAIKYFDKYVQQYGTSGANAQFSAIIKKVDDYDWWIVRVVKAHPELESQYGKMIKIKNKLIDRINNSDGLSY